MNENTTGPAPSLWARLIVAHATEESKGTGNVDLNVLAERVAYWARLLRDDLDAPRYQVEARKHCLDLARASLFAAIGRSTL